MTLVLAKQKKKKNTGTSFEVQIYGLCPQDILFYDIVDYSYIPHMKTMSTSPSNRKYTSSKWHGPHKMHCTGASAVIIHSSDQFKALMNLRPTAQYFSI